MTPLLIPTPAEVAAGADYEAFTFFADIAIALGDHAASTETLFAARQLQSAVRDATGLTLPIRKTRDPRGGVRQIALVVSGDEPGSNREAYSLEVSSRAITVLANAEAGLFYGVQTLKQLIRMQGARIPAMTIRDWPVLAHRGVMLDVSRGKVPSLQTLLALVDRLAEYKYNHIQLYIEHTFDFPGHPDIGAGTDPLSTDDILALDAWCRERHVELVANLQSFGHQRHMLSMPQYSHLDEVGWRWSLTPAREETYQLLDELYADFLPSFTSPWLNVDCDETWDLGTGQSRVLAAELGNGRLYLQHILRLRELAAKHGRRIMLWADILHHYPELISELPDDVLLLDWEYEAADHYATAEVLGKSGREFWVCPGTSSWNTLFPRLDNAVTNIQNFVRDGLQHNATGMLLTDWGDYGHYQPLSLSWYPYLFGAATAWTGAKTTPEEFDKAFASVFLGESSSHAVAAMRRLGRAVAAPTLGFHNCSVLAAALFEDPLKGSHSSAIDPQALLEVRAAAQEAIAAWAMLPDASLRYDYSFVARLVAFAADKVLLAQRIPTTPDAIASLVAARKLLPSIRAEFEACWLRHARRSEIHLTLHHFDVLERAYDRALAWLADGSAERDVGAYTPRPFAPLWEQGRQERRKLAELAGSYEEAS